MKHLTLHTTQATHARGYHDQHNRIYFISVVLIVFTFLIFSFRSSGANDLEDDSTLPHTKPTSAETRWGNRSDFDSEFRVTAVALQKDQKILVAGSLLNAGTDDFAVVRYDENDQFDSTFGNNGLVTTDFGGNFDRPLSISIRNDNRIEVRGQSCGNPETDCTLVTALYLPNGKLDVTFANQGILISKIYGVRSQEPPTFTQTPHGGLQMQASFCGDDGRCATKTAWYSSKGKFVRLTEQAAVRTARGGMVALLPKLQFETTLIPRYRGEAQMTDDEMNRLKGVDQ